MNSQRTTFSLQCPMPKLDFEVISMGHGSGGLLTAKLLSAGVFDLFKNEYLDQQHDGALLQMNGPVAFTTDSYVISPLFFPGGNIGDLAVNGSVNDLAMCGAIPKYLSLSFILEEGLNMKEFWEILVSIKAASELANVKIVTGDTKVVEKGKGDKIFINTSGLGELHPKASIHFKNVHPGDQIILSGPMAAHGISILSLREGLTFETTVQSDTAAVNHVVKDILDVAGQAIHFMRDPTRGGVATVLNEVAAQAGLGIDLWHQQFPINDQVAGACEMLGLDPLYIANEGLFISIVDKAAAETVLNTIRQHPRGASAAVIGEVTDKHPRQVVCSSPAGGRRIVNSMTGELLPRIC